VRPASPALFFAKLRSDKNEMKRLASSLRAGSLQRYARHFGKLHVHHAHQIDLGQAGGAGTAVPIVCRYLGNV
jgi:hypothetical protein